MSKDLTQEKAYIFRILHRQNVPWLLSNGLHCASSKILDPNYISIGNTELIEKRSSHRVPCDPGGNLSDYVPFYFTPASPMLYNIKTGWGGITKRANEDIVIVASSLRELPKHEVRFLFTDRHAYLSTARFFSNVDSLNQIDWDILQRRDFKRDPENPAKMDRYMAEALIYKHLPIAAILGLACYNDKTVAEVTKEVNGCGCKVKVVKKPAWYF
jgi:hypothetical protein